MFRSNQTFQKFPKNQKNRLILMIRLFLMSLNFHLFQKIR
jgi:hypothetical protein